MHVQGIKRTRANGRRKIAQNLAGKRKGMRANRAEKSLKQFKATKARRIERGGPKKEGQGSRDQRVRTRKR